MKKLGIFRGGYSRAFPLAVGLLSSFVAFAGTANVNVYWTRGFDGTGLFEETTTNNVFTEEGGTIFTDRLINGADAISDLDNLGVVNPNTGARTDDSITADYTNDGSVYLHIGYINSGFTGSGSQVQSINLNGDLVVGRMALENTYTRDGSTLKTANLPTGFRRA